MHEHPLVRIVTDTFLFLSNNGNLQSKKPEERPQLTQVCCNLFIVRVRSVIFDGCHKSSMILLIIIAFIFKTINEQRWTILAFRPQKSFIYFLTKKLIRNSSQSQKKIDGWWVLVIWKAIQLHFSPFIQLETNFLQRMPKCTHLAISFSAVKLLLITPASETVK